MRIETGAAWRGTVSGISWVAPAALATLAADAWDLGPLAPIALVVTVLGLVFAGYAAARFPVPSPLVHGAIAGGATWAVVQAAGLVVAVMRGSGVSALTLAASALVAPSAGVLGALFALRTFPEGRSAAEGPTP